ncbi:hypothetical protein HK097_003410 [Rhizophlyctis rosea]|uniref:Uncharacterized protein n=1 Tax=Rhizophlyctis rosea TaxID=64517 RepID=A0AAD5X9Z0_9FUNG|nr:hypothetical protein HK097_003410 [Rhizophlyctis rosea]
MSIAALNPILDYGAARFDHLYPHSPSQYNLTNLTPSTYLTMEQVAVGAPGSGSAGAFGFPGQQQQFSYPPVPTNSLSQPTSSTSAFTTSNQTTRKRKPSYRPDASDSDSDTAPSLITPQSTITTFPRRKLKRARLYPQDDLGFTSDSDSSMPFASSFAHLRIDPNASPAASEEGDGARYAFADMRLDGNASGSNASVDGSSIRSRGSSKSRTKPKLKSRIVDLSDGQDLEAVDESDDGDVADVEGDLDSISSGSTLQGRKRRSMDEGDEEAGGSSSGSGASAAVTDTEMDSLEGGTVRHPVKRARGPAGEPIVPVFTGEASGAMDPAARMAVVKFRGEGEVFVPPLSTASHTSSSSAASTSTPSFTLNQPFTTLIPPATTTQPTVMPIPYPLPIPITPTAPDSQVIVYTGGKWNPPGTYPSPPTSNASSRITELDSDGEDEGCDGDDEREEGAVRGLGRGRSVKRRGSRCLSGMEIRGLGSGTEVEGGMDMDRDGGAGESMDVDL